MNNSQFEQYKNISKEKFKFVNEVNLHDKKLNTKPMSYFKDAMFRFAKNKASIVGAIIISILILYSIIVPIFSPFEVADRDGWYTNTLPKVSFLEGTGFWDGTSREEISQQDYDYYNAIEQEIGRNVVDVIEKKISIDANFNLVTKYDARIDSYSKVGMVFDLLTSEEYFAIQEYQTQNNVQILYPMYDADIKNNTNDEFMALDANYWFIHNAKNGAAIYDENGQYQKRYLSYTGSDNYNSIRVADDAKALEETGTPLYNYAKKMQGGTYYCRYDYYEYFKYINNGTEPVFVFGTNGQGQDLFVCLASGARFSLLLAVFISVINLTIGTIYGAIEGYYGGATDLVMERILDIIAGVPFMIVVTLFKLHLVDKNIVGPIESLLFAFVLTGWTGMASSVRSQFYRYKHREYVLAARTLGARDARLIFKHILPNSLGTLITGCVLVIPGVIFSESSLSYLGIVNLETAGITSVGTLLSQGEGSFTSFPHIILFPALFISLLEISFNLFGNGLRDAFNPSLRGTEE